MRLMTETEKRCLNSLSQVDAERVMNPDYVVWDWPERVLLAVLYIRNLLISPRVTNQGTKSGPEGQWQSILALSGEAGWQKGAIEKLGGRKLVANDLLLLVEMASRLERNANGSTPTIELFTTGRDTILKGAAHQAERLDRDFKTNRNVAHFMFLSFALIGVTRELVKLELSDATV